MLLWPAQWAALAARSGLEQSMQSPLPPLRSRVSEAAVWCPSGHPQGV